MFYVCFFLDINHDRGQHHRIAQVTVPCIINSSSSISTISTPCTSSTRLIYTATQHCCARRRPCQGTSANTLTSGRSKPLQWCLTLDPIRVHISIRSSVSPHVTSTRVMGVLVLVVQEGEAFMVPRNPYTRLADRSLYTSTNLWIQRRDRKMTGSWVPKMLPSILTWTSLRLYHNSHVGTRPPSGPCS